MTQNLASLAAASIARAISEAAERWLDADFPPRVRATARIAERTGYSMPVVEYALDRNFEAITFAAIESVVNDELGGFSILDGFQPRAGRTAAWAAPVGRVCVISSRTSIGVALPPAIFALCAKCAVEVKDREDALVASFFETLAEERIEFAGAARAQAWSARDENAPDLRTFDAVVAFGRDDTLSKVREALRPDARFIAFGARASAGYVARGDLPNRDAARSLARAAARDIVLYDTEGCLSLHVLFVEDGGAVAQTEFSRMLDGEIAAAGIEFPTGQTTAARLSHARALAGFRESRGTAADLPPHFLPRMTTPVAVREPADALAYLRRHGVVLEGFAVSGGRDDVLRMAATAGAVHIARLGELQNPPLSGNHGGRSRISDFVRWIDKTF
jgi:hypothetical protein